MFRRLARWLLGDPIHTVKITSVINQNDPNKFFFTVMVTHDLTDLDNKFGLTFNLAAVASINGVILEDGRDDVTHMRLVNGSDFFVFMDIEDMLEMLGIDDEDDDDDDSDDSDEPTPVTSDDFEKMMSAQ